MLHTALAECFLLQNPPNRPPQPTELPDDPDTVGTPPNEPTMYDDTSSDLPASDDDKLHHDTKPIKITKFMHYEHISSVLIQSSILDL